MQELASVLDGVLWGKTEEGEETVELGVSRVFPPERYLLALGLLSLGGAGSSSRKDFLSCLIFSRVLRALLRGLVELWELSSLSHSLSVLKLMGDCKSSTLPG